MLLLEDAVSVCSRRQLCCASRKAPMCMQLDLTETEAFPKSLLLVGLTVSAQHLLVQEYSQWAANWDE